MQHHPNFELVFIKFEFVDVFIRGISVLVGSLRVDLGFDFGKIFGVFFLFLGIESQVIVDLGFDNFDFVELFALLAHGLFYGSGLAPTGSDQVEVVRNKVSEYLDGFGVLVIDRELKANDIFKALVDHWALLRVGQSFEHPLIQVLVVHIPIMSAPNHELSGHQFQHIVVHVLILNHTTCQPVAEHS